MIPKLEKGGVYLQLGEWSAAVKRNGAGIALATVGKRVVAVAAIARFAAVVVLCNAVASVARILLLVLLVLLLTLLLRIRKISPSTPAASYCLESFRFHRIWNRILIYEVTKALAQALAD